MSINSWKTLSAIAFLILVSLTLSACSGIRATTAREPSTGEIVRSRPAKFRDNHGDSTEANEEVNADTLAATAEIVQSRPAKFRDKHGDSVEANEEAIADTQNDKPEEPEEPDEMAETDEDMAAAHGLSAEAAMVENPVPADAASVARGAEIFQTRCAVCHGATGLGDGPGGAGLDPKPANLTANHVQANTDGSLFATISEGVEGSAMIGWKNQFSEEDRWSIVNFLRTLPDSE